MRALRPALVLAAALLAPEAARASFDALPPLAQTPVLEMVEACTQAGGQPGDPMMAIERVDLDDDGTPDVILDENRFDCRGRSFRHCQAFGCQTTIFLSDRGRWRPSLTITGSYCLEYGRTPTRFVTIQRNFDVGGGMSILNVRYRFRRGMYFQDGRGSC